MTVQKNNIDSGLIKLAAVTGALLLMNYFLWQIGMSFFTKFIPLIMFFIVVVFFVQKKTFLNYMPLIIFLVSMVFISLGSPTRGWDARTIWLFHAKRIFLENNFYAQMDDYAPGSHNDYPLFVPAISATLAKLIGYWNEVFPKFASVLAIMPPFFTLASLLKSKIRQVLFCIFLLFVMSNILINGYMDGVLAIYFVSAFFIAYILATEDNIFSREQRLWLYFLLATTLTSLTLIKNEGSVLLVVLMLSIVARFLIKKIKISLPMVVVCGLSVIPIVIWRYVCVKNGIKNDLTQSDLLAQFMMRAPVFSNYVKICASLFINVGFVVSMAAFIFVSREVNDRDCKPFVIFSAVLYLGVLFVIYMSTPYDLEWHLVNSTDRTMLPIIFMLGYYALMKQKNLEDL